jgi:hypothetical protein
MSSVFLVIGSRDTRISRQSGCPSLKALNASDDVICPCLIIYPNIYSGVEEFYNEKLLDAAETVTEYLRFYKIGIKLPINEHRN